MSSPQTLECQACGWKWGPVGVVPYSPTAPLVQFLVFCEACRKPAAVMAPPAPLEVPCGCGAVKWHSLDQCLGCGSQEIRWGLAL